MVTMTCMTTKQKFDVENPTVIVLRNGRYAFKVECPWEGKNGKQLFAFKFCSASDYEAFMSTTGPTNDEETGETFQEESGDEQQSTEGG